MFKGAQPAWIYISGTAVYINFSVEELVRLFNKGKNLEISRKRCSKTNSKILEILPTPLNNILKGMVDKMELKPFCTFRHLLDMLQAFINILTPIH